MARRRTSLVLTSVPGIKRGSGLQATRPSSPSGPSRPSTHRPGTTNAIAISIGPVDDDNEELREWITFPVTPASIPVDSQASWADGVYGAKPGEPEAMRFIGPATRTASFSGQLEPPAYYIASGRPGVADRLAGYINPDQLANLRADILTGPGSGDLPGPLQLTQRAPAVVMQEGAMAGPGTFYEPHAFVAILEGVRDSGEVIRLVIGDQYGLNTIATVRGFSWRYEDPDPDVINYDVAFKEHNERSLSAAGKGKKKASTPKSYTTKSGDTLHRIAGSKLHDAAKWKTLLRLNHGTLAKLWVGGAIGSNKLGSLGKDRPPGAPKLGDSGATHLSPDRPFRPGVVLKLR